MPLCLPRFAIPSTRALLHPPVPNVFRVRPFSHTAALSADSHAPTHYETLNVPVTATTAEIKKQFYALSLAHHPDRNPDDPNAHAKFTLITSAYHVLSHTTRRARYDRDHQIHQRPVHYPNARGSQANKASFVGSRPPSGLSKRRGAFRGPPPSFYAHGGYGAGRHSRPHASNTSTSGTTSSDPESPFRYSNPVSHFDAQSHFRTQMHEDERRRIRRHNAIEREKARIREQGGVIVEDAEGGMTVRFFIILTIVGVGIGVASIGRSLGPAPQPPMSARRDNPSVRAHSSAKREGAREAS
ncbi:hypothetical protein AJ79_01769 [Helicocarpus griseus UAMH5409]|uniref:J domain-containing protein n=1 Tax=Helicocarpus griseus UAMH5409 TaxID=1447875 RepID=A0A2B7Y6D8_9EURO|nr:hypothetical protein AJ79_01769 [Helicocarpus griseus UAMH5409]